MSFYDSLTNTTSDVATGLDTTSIQGDGTSIFDSAANIVTKGVPLTALSIINSFANTGIKVANFFGADVDPIDPYSQAKDFFGDATADYYTSHQGLIEGAGLAIGSFAPGLLALKALKLAQATGETGSILGRALGVFSGARSQAIADATAQINLGKGALFVGLDAAKYKAIAAGFGDQALQALVWETASLATQNASPLLSDMDLKDTLLNVGFGTLFGGAIGGAVEGLSTALLFRKTITKATIDSNIYEAITRFGGADPMVGAGDRAASIFSSLDAIPAAQPNTLGSTRFNSARQNAILDAKKFLQSIGPTGDVLPTNTFTDALLAFKEQGLSSGEDTYNLLMRLGKVSRISVDEAETAAGSIPTGEHFYVNRFASKSDASFDNLVSIGSGIDNLPDKAANSLLYRMMRPGDQPVIGRFTDELAMPDGSTIPRYDSAKAAFADNNDIFIDKKLNIFVNPDSDRLVQIARRGENEPLSRKSETEFNKTGSVPAGIADPVGAPLVFNNFTGAITSTARAVVGDIGEASLVNSGLLVGKQVIPQTMEGILTAETPSFEANSRYVWAGLRGIKQGDIIDPRDLPFLEQLYREATNFQSTRGNLRDFAELKTRQGVKIVNGETGEEFSIPQTGDAYQKLILQQKNSFIGELLSEGGASKLSSEEIAQRANVPESYLEAGLKSQTFSGATVPLERNLAVNHVKLEYNLNNFYRNDEGAIARGAQDLQYRIKTIQDAADSALASYSGDKFQDFKLDDVKSQQVGPEGAGAGFFSAANAQYGTIAQKFERVGRALADFLQGKNKVTTDALYSSAQALRSDVTATAEQGLFDFVRHTTNEKFAFLPAEIAAHYKLSSDTAVLAGSLIKNRRGEIIDWDKNYTPRGFMPFEAHVMDHAGIGEERGLKTTYSLSPKVADFERANLALNDARITQRNNFSIASGLQPKLEPGILYAPPIDTAKYPYFAYVVQKEGTGFGTNSASVIVGKTDAELQQKITSLKDEFDVYTKSDLKKYHEVQGDYDYDRNFSQNVVNSALARRGILNNVVPDTSIEKIIRDRIDFHSRQDTRLARDFVELGNAQLFAEIRAFGERYTGTETSKTGFTPASLGKTEPNPYNDLIKTALAISPKENYRLWNDAQEKLEAFFSSAFQAAKDGFSLAKKDILPFEQANDKANQMGLGNVYSNMINAAQAYEDASRSLPPQRFFSKFVSTANSVMAATAIRLDFFQALINVVSTPVLALAEAHSAKSAIQEMLSTQLPGAAQGVRIPSTTKLMYQAITSFVRNDALHQELTPLFKQIGVLKNDNADFYRMQDAMTLPLGKLSESQWADKIQSMVDLGSKYTGNNLAEELSRYVPGYMAHRIFSAAGQAGRDLTDNITTFVNRVQGNYVAAQRPVAFQGPLGQAIGLFQTYQVNMLQQMMRYVQNGEGKTLAILAGAQSTLFGVNGLPGFQAINQHLIGAAPGNPSHADAYSTLTSSGIASTNPLQKDVGDYLLYGVLSNWLSTGLYSRGDINPRNITVLPINPLDYPAISGGIKLVSTLLGVSRNLANGASVPSSLLLGLEHNGLSRPLAGMAQLAQGFVTTGQGGIIATTRPGMADNTMGWSEMASIANFSRLLGARPLDEAVVLDSTYRRTLYQAADRTRIEALGEAFKSNIYGSNPDPELVSEFTSKYAAAGGNIANYGKTILSWTQNANASVANSIYKQLQTPANQNMIRSMGGVKLPDFTTYNPGIPNSVSQTAPTE